MTQELPNEYVLTKDMPIHLSVYNNTSGEKVREIEAVQPFLQVKPKSSVVHQVVVAQMSNARSPIAHTKTRAEVRGGGRKPWRQKGTGRARHGSIRSPIWRGGGIIFGPRSDRNFHQKVNKKMKQKALFMCLSEKAQSDRMFLLESFQIEPYKTKRMVELFEKLPSKDHKVLIVLEGSHPSLVRSVRNIPYMKAVSVNSLNVMDVLENDFFVTTEQGLNQIEMMYHKLHLSKRIA